MRQEKTVEMKVVPHTLAAAWTGQIPNLGRTLSRHVKHVLYKCSAPACARMCPWDVRQMMNAVARE